MDRKDPRRRGHSVRRPDHDAALRRREGGEPPGRQGLRCLQERRAPPRSSSACGWRQATSARCAGRNARSSALRRGRTISSSRVGRRMSGSHRVAVVAGRLLLANHLVAGAAGASASGRRIAVELPIPWLRQNPASTASADRSSPRTGHPTARQGSIWVSAPGRLRCPEPNTQMERIALRATAHLGYRYGDCREARHKPRECVRTSRLSNAIGNAPTERHTP